MASYNEGKAEVCSWIRERFSDDASILDVGACDGKWRKLLPEYQNMDAVEIFPPNARQIEDMYRAVYCGDICDLKYKHYDLVIFGDVLEHMSVEKAQAVLDYARGHCKDFVIGIPWEYKQDAIYGNEWERHIQDDLTPDIFDERFPGCEAIHKCSDFYCYYHKSGSFAQEETQ